MDSTILSAVIAAVVSLVIGVITTRYQRSMLREKRIEDKRKEIYKKLNDFYGPMKQYLAKSYRLYELFRVDKDANRAENEPRFSTLTALIRGTQFQGDDKEILDEIIRLGEDMENLILEKAGLVDDSELGDELLPDALAHFFLIRIANQGRLKKDYNSYVLHTFPNKLPEAIDRRINQLRTELKELNSP